MSELSRLTKQLVDLRDRHRCVRCGRSLEGIPASRHHRKLRSQARRAEVHTVANLIDVCGTGSTLCHGWIHNHVSEARKQGFLVRSTADPTRIPIHLYTGSWGLLNNYGGITIVEAPNEQI